MFPVNWCSEGIRLLPFGNAPFREGLKTSVRYNVIVNKGTFNNVNFRERRSSSHAGTYTGRPSRIRSDAYWQVGAISMPVSSLNQTLGLTHKLSKSVAARPRYPRIGHVASVVERASTLTGSKTDANYITYDIDAFPSATDQQLSCGYQSAIIFFCPYSSTRINVYPTDR